MKVDFYTKGLLLLIAVFLGIIALNSCTTNIPNTTNTPFKTEVVAASDRKFQYKQVVYTGGNNTESVLNEYGAQGWELVIFDPSGNGSYNLIFKK